jgi:hypothetical protein
MVVENMSSLQVMLEDDGGEARRAVVDDVVMAEVADSVYLVHSREVLLQWLAETWQVQYLSSDRQRRIRNCSAVVVE